ncbi:hypothetical protein PV10_05573 [Exophiala mesophila]|uniref:Transcription factor domain-containing protein n=1 Tax=Exophiala mesophila TaxID=212818 RepID=A0A0D1ZW36_EXOME|nr:uncharacterized protein PV10_05573 [Exophiala mesophila]KIV90978.1 hypothetical protein PV10_05573 [Exophiala mesophila]
MVVLKSFTFINNLDSNPVRHAKELQLAQIRSHVSKVTHKNARMKQTVEADPEPTPRRRGCRSNLRTTALHHNPDPHGPLCLPDHTGDDHVCSTCKHRSLVWDRLETPSTCRDQDRDRKTLPAQLATSSRPTRTFTTPSHLPSTFRYRDLTDGLPVGLDLGLEAFRGLRTNAFRGGRAARDCVVDVRMDQYFQYLAPRFYLVCDVFHITNIYAAFLMMRENTAFSHASVATTFRLMETRGPTALEPSYNVLNHRGHAISLLRKTLATKGADFHHAALMIMTFLTILEEQLGNMQAFEIHRKNVSLLVQQCGGIDAFEDGGAIKGTLLQWDTIWDMQTGKSIFAYRHLAPKVDYPKLPHDQDTLRLTTTMMLPPGLQTLGQSQRLSTHALVVLARAADYTRRKAKGPRPGWAPQVDSGRRYNDFSEACPALNMPEDPQCKLENLVCTCLIVYCCLAFVEARCIDILVRGARTQLTQRVPGFHPLTSPEDNLECHRAEQQCQIWMWILTVDSWRIVDVPYHQRASALGPPGHALLCKLLQEHPHLCRLEEVEKVVGKFLWTEELRKSLSLYWELTAADIVVAELLE